MRTDNDLKTDIKCLLLHGKKNAKTGKELAQILGYDDDRAIRLSIRNLIAEGVPVAASVDMPKGYFIASSIDESEHYMRVLRSRLVNDAYRRHDFKLAARSILQPGQLSLL